LGQGSTGVQAVQADLGSGGGPDGDGSPPPPPPGNSPEVSERFSDLEHLATMAGIADHVYTTSEPNRDVELQDGVRHIRDR
jgi:hypothetical protein